MGSVFLLTVICMALMRGGEILPSLREILQNAKPDEKIAVLVHLKERPDYESLKNLSSKYILLNILENDTTLLYQRFKEGIDIGITLGYLENKNTDGISVGGVGNIRFFTIFNLQTSVMKNFFGSSPNNEQKHYNITGELNLNFELIPIIIDNNKKDGVIYVGAGITNMGSLFLFTIGFRAELFNGLLINIQYKNTQFLDNLTHIVGFKGYNISITRRFEL